MSEESYRVGIELALKGGLGEQIDKVLSQFEKLDETINRGRDSINNFTGATAAAAREAGNLADAWRGVARATAAAAREADRVRTAAGAAGAPPSAAAARREPASPAPLVRLPTPTETGRRTIAAAMTGAGGIIRGEPNSMPVGSDEPRLLTGPTEPLRLTGPRTNALVPYRSTSTDFDTVGRPYTPYGGYSPTRPPRSPAGGALVPYAGGAGAGGDEPPGGGGFTLNGGPYRPEGGPIVPYSDRPIPLSGGPYADRLAWDGQYMMGGPRKIGHGDPVMAGIVAAVGAETIKSTIARNADVQNIEAGLRAQGFAKTQIGNAYKEAFSTMETVTGTSVTGNLRLLADLQATFQNAKESLALLPKYAKMQVELGRFGQSGESEMQALIKASEEVGAVGQVNPKTGKFEINRTKLDSYLKSVMAAVAITRGQVDPRMLLQFQRSANWVSPNLPYSELIARNLALAQAMGASKAGRGLFATEQQWAAGQMSEAAVNEAIQFHLIRGGGNAKTNRNVKVKGFGTYVVMPNGWAPGVSHMLRTNPQGFLTGYLVPHLDGWLEKHIHGFDRMNPRQRAFQEIRLGSALASRDPARAYFAELIELRGLIERDQIAWNKAMKRNLGKLLTGKNAEVQIEGLTAALEGLQIAAGKPAMKQVLTVLHGVTGGLDGLSTIANAHPGVTKAALDGIAAAIAGLGVGSAAYVAMLALSGPAGLLAAVAAGIVGLTEAATSLDKYLQHKWPSVFTDKPLRQIEKKGLAMPWWWPEFMAPKGAPHLAAPRWLPGHNEVERLLGWDPTKDWHTVSNAPVLPHHRNHDPVPVHVVSGDVNAHLDPHESAHSMSQILGHHMNQPPNGRSGYDATVTPWGAYSGLDN